MSTGGAIDSFSLAAQEAASEKSCEIWASRHRREGLRLSQRQINYPDYT